MKLNYIRLSVYTIVFLFIALSACKDDSKEELSAKDLEINNFIWENMSMYYLWTENVPELNPSKYLTQKDLNSYLNQYGDHESFFNSLLYKRGIIDRFSWIVDDYGELEKGFKGESKSMGFDYMLGVFEGSDEIFGIVRYVVKGSPADIAGLKRGDAFTKINNTQLTISNYENLLSKESYSLNIAGISNNTIYDKHYSISMVAAEIQENPIYLDTIYHYGQYTIGYLVYNGFMPNYDNQLNAVFAKFKTNKINKLILDLRYNPGGAESSATYLASMIYSTDTTKIFVKNSFNSQLQQYLEKEYGSRYFNIYFKNMIEADADNGLKQEPINSLGLSDLYVITSRSSASASELLINGLRPYIPVTIIGDTTYGKYVGSITIKDYNSQGVVNPNHKWAMQPIVLKISNINGVSDYYNGLPSDVYTIEDWGNLLPFGYKIETMFSAAISHILNKNTVKSNKNNTIRTIAERNDLVPHKREMYVKLKGFVNRLDKSKQ